MAKELGGKTLTVLITDGLPAYQEAFNKDGGALKQDSVHINAIKLSGGMNNDKMERFNGSIRYRKK